MDLEAIDALRMDFQNLISCIECHEESSNEEIILETLKTIIDICDNESCGRDAFREEGGLDFLVEFMFTTDNTIYLEHLLKTLAFVVDENIHSQMYLTKRSVFEVIQTILKKNTFPVTVQKNTLLLVSAILYQNSSAQILILEVGLIHDLLNIFECGAQNLLTNNICTVNLDSFATDVWLTTNSTLCFAVNNPQNEKNQEIGSAIFPVSLRLLESSPNPSIIGSLSSFLSLCVANNVRCQDKFAECDGLHLLKRCFQRYCDAVAVDVQECNNVIGTGTLQAISNLIGIISASGADHEKNSALLGKLGLLSLMIKLLFVETLGVSLKTKIILSLGHCIDSCNANKSYIFETSNFDSLLKKALELGDQELSSASKYLLQVSLINEDTCQNPTEEEKNAVGNASLSENCCSLKTSNPLNSHSKKNEDVSKNVCKERRAVKRLHGCSSNIKIKNDLNEEVFLSSPPSSNNTEKTNPSNKKQGDIFLSPSVKKSRVLIVPSTFTSTRSVKRSGNPASTHSQLCTTAISLSDENKLGSVCSHPESTSLFSKLEEAKPKRFLGHKTYLNQDQTNCKESNSKQEFKFTPILAKVDDRRRKRPLSPISVSSHTPKRPTLSDVTNFDRSSKKDVGSNAKYIIKTPVKKYLLTERFQTPVKSCPESLHPSKLYTTHTVTESFISDKQRQLLSSPDSEKQIDVWDTPSVAPVCSKLSSGQNGTSKLLKRKLDIEGVLQQGMGIQKNVTISSQPNHSLVIPETPGRTDFRSVQTSCNAAVKTNTSHCETSQSSDSSTCMQVIVFPGETCEQHNLIASFEMLGVVSLDDVNGPGDH